MKNSSLLLCMLITLNLFAQKDSLQLGDAYLEDQLYFGVTYNQLVNQPDVVIGSGFSYGFSAGYVRDISLVKSGKLALGIGIGYAYDSFNHGYMVTTQNNNIVLEINPAVTTSNDLNLHAIEFPFEIRWRTSDANKYKFWRIYTGFKLSYNFKNTINFTSNSVLNSYSNIDRLNKVQYGVTMSAGYSTFNFNLYYGLTPLFNDASLGTSTIDTKQIKLGILFYIL